jgi:hypothetical protein
MTFVESVDPDQRVVCEEVFEACQDISAYSRPSHVIVVEAGKMPLNRVAKTDYMALKQTASDAVVKLRAEGKWDN